VIVDAEAIPTRTYDEVAATRTMIERTEARFDLKPRRLAADTAYGTGKIPAWLVEHGIEPHIPVWDRSTRKDSTFSRVDFSYDGERDVYTCPRGKALKSSGKVLSDNTLRYLASICDCGPCPLKARCCPHTPQCKIPRDINEHARDYARSLAGLGHDTGQRITPPPTLVTFPGS
jgi:hypothetical protein